MLSPNLIPVLCLMLGSPSWHTRELAHKSLQNRPDAVPYLRACQGCKSPEIAGRATQILGGIYRANAERLTDRMAMEFGKFPWADMLPWDHPEKGIPVERFLGKSQWMIKAHSGSPEWEEYRFATRLYVQSLFAQGVSPETVREILAVMFKAEVNWIHQSGNYYRPPIEIPLRRD